MPDTVQPAGASLLRIALCGDVMTGRGIDQILPHPGNPVLHEAIVRDARQYVRAGEKVNGPLTRPVDVHYIWGDALAELDRADLRVANLETSITSCDDYWPNKGINYRMHPGNIGCLTAAHIDCCCLANNHVLDWGYHGLAETLETLEGAGVAHAGAGRNALEAASPAAIEIAGKGRVLVFSFGSTTSGIPWRWGATKDRAGVNLLRDLSEDTAAEIADQLHDFARTGDTTIASIHWGENWGYRVPDDQIRFARLLIDSGFDVVHGHSSHHIKTIELYRDHLILYGCGDLINDYEGISGYEEFRSDLGLVYLTTLDSQDGRLVEASFVPMQFRRFRLNRATEEDAKWVSNLLNRLSVSARTEVEMKGDNSLRLQLKK